MDVRRPPFKSLLEERDGPIRLLFRLRGPGIPREKRVVLVAALADVLCEFRSSALSTRGRRGDGVAAMACRQGGIALSMPPRPSLATRPPHAIDAAIAATALERDAAIKP